MATPRRQSNGRSPLVNQQRQITSFFSKSNCPSPSPTFAKQTSKLNPNSKRSPSKSPSPSPATPSPFLPKLKKPLLVIGQTPSATPSKPVDKSYGKEVVEKRIRVYWPLDKAWYEGVVKFFDKESGKHLVQYDDAEEEELDLGKEKIEWVKESTGILKRLRRGGSSSAFKNVVIDDEDDGVAENAREKSDDDVDDSSDEDWGRNVEKEVSEDVEEEHMDLEDEKEEGMEMSKRKGAGKTESKKRKASGGGGGKLESGKKSKTSANVSGKEEFKVSLVEPVKNIEGK